MQNFSAFLSNRSGEYRTIMHQPFSNFKIELPKLHIGLYVRDEPSSVTALRTSRTYLPRHIQDSDILRLKARTVRRIDLFFSLCGLGFPEWYSRYL